MPHPDDLKPKMVKLEVRPEVYRLLSTLAENGLFGQNATEVADLLLHERLREVVLQGWVGVPGFSDGRTQPLIRR